MSAGYFHTCGLTPSGAAYCWGGGGVLAPTPVAGGLTFTVLSAGLLGDTCGVTPSGAAYCWGGNSDGELGDGTTNAELVPTPVAGGFTFASVNPGVYHTCGVTLSGAAYCWGSNAFGQLGDGTTTQRLVPTPVAGGLTFTAVSAGWWHTCGVSWAGWTRWTGIGSAPR